MDLKRQVKVKTGVVKRLRKELAMYQEEKVQNDKRVEDMRASGADTYDVRQAVSSTEARVPPMLRAEHPRARDLGALPGSPNDLPLFSLPPQERVADESAMMIPDCKQRFEAAYTDLQGLAVRSAAEPARPSRCPSLAPSARWRMTDPLCLSPARCFASKKPTQDAEKENTEINGTEEYKLALEVLAG